MSPPGEGNDSMKFLLEDATSGVSSLLLHGFREGAREIGHADEV